MAQFDFIECAGRAYKFVWDERDQVLRMSGIVLGIKALSIFAVFLMGIEENFLRMGLLLLPSHFVEGVVIAQILVMAVYEKQFETLQKSRLLAAPPILGGAILYVLIKMVISLVLGMTIIQGEMPEPPANAPDPSVGTFFMACAMMVFLIWAFRLFWIYIPVVLGYGVDDYLNHFSKFRASFPMIGVWLFCFVPVGVSALFLIELVKAGFPFEEGAANYGYHVANSIVQSFIDYAMALLSTLGIGFGIYGVLSGTDKSEPPKLF